MAGIDYWDEEAVCCGHNVPVAQLLIDGWAKGEDEVISALDRYTYESGDRFIGETLLHLRRIHKKPMYRGAPSSSANLPETSNMEGVTLKHFRKKSPNAQKALLKKAVKRLQGEYDNNGNALFANKQDWIGVYLLVKSQLKMHFTQKDFPDYAKQITPDDFPDDLKIGSSTISNISHLGLPDTPYYMWSDNQKERNPMAARMGMICSRLWLIIGKLVYDIS
jgi:hypothetical protein